MTRKRILLTGSEGKVAANIIRPALEDRFEIVGFDLVLGDDLMKPESIDRKIGDIDYVIHTAAIPGPRGAAERESYMTVNVEGSRNLIEKSKATGVSRFVFFSSFSRYGVDSWMRHRDEKGPVTGDDVAVPRYLPIDERHPSILSYQGLHEWGGKWYGESKAMVEEIGAKLAGDGFSFVSLRLAGVAEKTEKWVRARENTIQMAGAGRAVSRKQVVYGTAGIATKKLVTTTLHAMLDADLRGFNAFNVCEATRGNEDIVRTYFPGIPVTDQIFGNEKLRVLLNKTGYEYTPAPVPKNYGTTVVSSIKRKLGKAVGR